MNGESVVILLVEDRPAHAEAVRRALKVAGADVEIQTVGTLREYRMTRPLRISACRFSKKRASLSHNPPGGINHFTIQER